MFNQCSRSKPDQQTRLEVQPMFKKPSQQTREGRGSWWVRGSTTIKPMVELSNVHAYMYIHYVISNNIPNKEAVFS